MVLISVLGLVLTLSAGANRISREEHHLGHHTQAVFGASCEDLQSTFRSHMLQIASLQASEEMTTATQARLSMRSLRIIRTMRRARTCTWLQDSDSEDIEQVRALAQSFLESNPCTAAARAELEAGTNAETEEISVTSLTHAMQILASEECVAEAAEDEAGPVDAMSEDELVEVVRSGEDAGDNSVEELLMTSETAGSFVQSDVGTVRSFMRRLGAFFFALLMVLACVSGVAAVLALIAYAISNIFFYELTGCSPGQRCGWLFVPYATLLAGGLGALIGLPGCASMAHRVLS